MRILLPLAAAAALVLAIGGALAPTDAAAQPAVNLQPAQAPPPAARPGAVQPGAVQPGAAQPGAAAAPRAAAVKADPRLNPKAPPHLDQVQSTGKGMAILFWAFALATVAGAVFVITRRNLIAAVMGMVGSFVGISAVYMMLYASFLAVIQMLVYAGAIMVLFVFVVMILNRPEDEPVAPSGRIGHAVGVAAMVYLVFRLAMLLVGVKAPEEAMGPPKPHLVTVMSGAPACNTTRCEALGGRCATVTTGQPQVCRVEHEWGTVRSVGSDLFGPGVFPFEAISILLLVAVVGAIAIARPPNEDDRPDADAGADGGAGASTPGGHS
jgi:NADH-quinone oxidoreductase subunit J